MNETADSLWFLALCGVVIGLILGSFVTMLSYRLPRRISIISPPSTCPSCGTRLGFFDLFPVFSWVFCGGACRHCQAKIGIRYPLIELCVALFSTFSFVLLGFSLFLPLALALIVALATVLTIKIEFFIR
jgi:prepilin signal peptidase PulO-like enzyme (type II secretory pathway)